MFVYISLGKNKKYYYMLGNLIKYSDFYTAPIPDNPIELIIDIPKEELIATIVAINTRLKPLGVSHFDDSRDTQINCLRTIFLDNENHIEQSFCLSIINKYIITPSNNNLFSRVTCLYALQEILNFNGFTKETPEYNFDNRERIFKFLLIANNQILKGDSNYKKEGYEQLGNDFFEFFMFRELHHNQYNECSNSINVFYKSWFLLHKIENHHIFSNHFKNYLTWYYKVENADAFLKNIFWAYIKSYDETLKLRYLNVLKSELDTIKVLDAFSADREFKVLEKDNLEVFDFSRIKKSPLFKGRMKDEKDTIGYLILDDGFFLEKAYSLLINDFWFDYLKPNEICTRKDWGSFIGTDFYEPFLCEIFLESFSNTPEFIFRSTDELKFKIEGRPIEYADFYIREKQNIALIEAKSSYLAIINGYKTVSTIDDFRKLNLEEFYDDYGLVQLVSKTIKKFHLYKNHIADDKFNSNRKVQLYPILIVNDPIFSSSLASFVFKRKFNELLEKEGINKKAKEHNIKDLCIMNVSHLQDMEQSLIDKKNNFFKILDTYLLMSNYNNKANFNRYNFLRTFDHVLHAKIKEGLIANRIKGLKWLEE
ncbi:hypothetical protein [Flavobacterium chungangense]|uniref:Uncharacterized protein n=1 Tax=Flavobacterium chungangense TaxID=554283 RepID=A0A6V6Z5Q7_9FLAO|nr:hypothetical protein [Flavobacterium chungangense]CAD0007128.1 hypothetical protein FLACHUCJ7_03189 [Flavobacterium chungangense]